MNVQLLANIAQGKVDRVTQAEGLELVKAGYLQVDTSNVVDGKALVQITETGKALVQSQSNGAATSASFAVIKGAVMPKAKRGGGRGGAPVKYPFAQLEVGDTFFVADSAVKKGNAAKGLGSTVSAQNMHFSEPTGEMKTVTRSKRGPKNKPVMDAAGNKVMETVQVAVRKPTRKFSIRPVVGGQKYGEWTAPENGALIARIL